MARDLADISEGALSVMPQFMRHDAKLANHLPYVSLVDDRTIRTRGNEFIQCLRVSGINSFTSDSEVLDKVRHLFRTTIAQAGAGFSFYVHKISKAVDLRTAPIEGTGFDAHVDEKWQRHLAAAGLRDRTLTITIVKRPPVVTSVPLFSWVSRRALAGQTAGQIRQLEEVVAFLAGSLAGMNARVLTASSGELLGFLEAINTGIELPCFPSGVGASAIVASQIANNRVTFQGRDIHITGGSVPDRVGQIYAIKEYPTDSFCTMFDDLSLPLDMVTSHSFTPVNSTLMIDRIKRAIRMMRSTEDAAISLRADLEAALDDVASGRVIFGDHHMSVAVYSSSLDGLSEAASDIRNIAASAGLKMLSEPYSTRAHYFAQHPGNAALRSRRGLITNSNFADFAALHRTPLGKSGENTPWGTPIAIFPTPEGSGFKFSFHEKGNPKGEPTSGHTIILGRPGSGKSLLATFLITQARRANARIFAFDYRRGLEMGVRALGGSYQSISAGVKTGLNPLWTEIDPGGTEWLTDWLVTLLESRGAPLTPQQTNFVQQVVRQNAEASDSGLRNWDDFARLFRSMDDGGDLTDRMREWTSEGRFGWTFASTLEDTFSLDGDVVGFDLTGILDADNETARMAVLSYIFRRIERKIEDRRPTIVVIDEAWKALDNAYFARRLEDWLVTARKQQTVLLCLTQFASQLAKTQVASTFIQAMPTQILLPNARAKFSDYEMLNLSEKEMSVMLGTSPSSRLGLVRDDQGSVVINADLSALGNLMTVMGGLGAGEGLVGADYRDDPDFWRKVL